MRKIILSTAAAAVALIAMPAAAQDGPFTGARVEALVGYDNISLGFDDSDIEDALDEEDIDTSVDGFKYGVALGYDFQMGGVVVGAEVELNDSTAKIGEDGLGEIGAGRDIYIGGRLGYVVTPQTMIYAKAGYTNARLDVEGTYEDFDGEDVVEYDVDANLDLDGFRLGAGVEHMMTPNVYVKGEYRYSRYDLDDISDLVDLGDIDAHLNRHQVVVGVGFRF